MTQKQWIFHNLGKGFCLLFVLTGLLLSSSSMQIGHADSYYSISSFPFSTSRSLSGYHAENSHWYSTTFDVSAGTKVRVSLSVSSSADFDLAIYGEFSTEPDCYSAREEGLPEPIFGYDESCSWTVPSAQIVDIRVVAWYGSGSYTLQVWKEEWTPPPPPPPITTPTTTTTPISIMPPSEEPILYFSFESDTVQGDKLLDISPYGNDGIIHGTNMTPIGKVGTALSFDGNDDYVEAYPFDYNFQEITVEFWLKTQDTTKEGALISGSKSGQSDNEFLIYNYQNIKPHIDGLSIVTGISVNDGTWHHIVFTWQNSDGSIKIFKDSVIEYSGSLGKGAIIQLGNLILGQDQDQFRGGFDSKQALLGILDEVRIYNRVVSPEEIAQHYQDTIETTPPITTTPEQGKTTTTSSTFDTNTEGWTIFGDAQVEYVASGGNLGGYISATDQSTGITWFFEAPTKFLGNISAAYGQLLTFELKQSRTDNQNDVNTGDAIFNSNIIPDIVLVKDELMLLYNFPGSPGTSWTPHSVRLDEFDGWRNDATGHPATQVELITVLSSLTALWIRGEYRSGSDTGGLDNVILNLWEKAPTVTIVSPNGGESLKGANTITWMANDPQGDTLTFTVYYSLNEGQNWIIIAEGLTDLFCQWDTTMVPDGSAYLIKVEASDGTQTGMDVSDASFEIANGVTRPSTNTAPTINIIRPNGGERVHGLYEIRWSVNDLDGDTLMSTIYYSPNSGQTWTKLASGVTDTSYSWDTSRLQTGSNYLIKVEVSDGTLTAEDASDATFTVSPEATSMETSPGEVFVPGLALIETGGAILVLCMFKWWKRKRNRL